MNVVAPCFEDQNDLLFDLSNIRVLPGQTKCTTESRQQAILFAFFGGKPLSQLIEHLQQEQNSHSLCMTKFIMYIIF